MTSGRGYELTPLGRLLLGVTAPDPHPLPPDGPYCSSCSIRRVLTPSGICPVCLDEKGRP